MKQEQTVTHEDLFPVATGVWGKKEVFVNFYMIQDSVSGDWALIDGALKWSALSIKKAAAELFGDGVKPKAIILTHGHFDHVGALAELLAEWDVPVYAHEMELPYLTGKSSYPPPDPTAGGGLMSALSFLYPAGPINISSAVIKLPLDGSVPGFSEWKYIATPGHSPGHISLYRESDKVIIAGDAFVTTKAESAFYAFTFKEHLSGPPKYFTCDWEAAKESVLKLNALNPEIIATGHGKPMLGVHMREQLDELALHFGELAKPRKGKYVKHAAITNKYGAAAWPEGKNISPVVAAVGVGIIAGIAACLLHYSAGKKKM